MGYFSNGTEWEFYEAEYCTRCAHVDGPDGKSGCPIVFLHMLHNYDECNKEDSFLHVLIPRRKDGYGNEKCTMFFDKALKPLFVEANQDTPASRR